MRSCQRVTLQPISDVKQVAEPASTRVVVPPIPGLTPEQMHRAFTLAVQHAVKCVHDACSLLRLPLILLWFRSIA